MKIILNFSTSFQKLVRGTIKVTIFCLYFSIMEMISFNFYEHIVKDKFCMWILLSNICVKEKSHSVIK